MNPYSVAILVYGDATSGRNALTEEKYRDFGQALIHAGFQVTSVVYNDSLGEKLYTELSSLDAILVWVNPIEQGNDRRKLDALLIRLADQGCLISTHPDIILKIGTKDILFKTRDMGWGGNIQLYKDPEDFQQQFPSSLQESGIRIIKQYRGNGGNGVFKVMQGDLPDEIKVIHAQNGDQVLTYTSDEFFTAFQSYFSNEGVLIEQEWNHNHVNGMVRCYICGNKVAGFGYQEINALYEIQTATGLMHLPPGKRYYFTENCGLFDDLKKIMEDKWVPQLQMSQSISEDQLPIIWDADFFINKANSPSPEAKYTLCEINVSCVSPFPPSAIDHMVKELKKRISKK